MFLARFSINVTLQQSSFYDKQSINDDVVNMPIPMQGTDLVHCEGAVT